MPNSSKNQKDDIRSKILRAHGFPSKVRALILIDIVDTDIRNFLLSAGKSLDIAMIESTGTALEKGEYSGFDGFLSDTIGNNLDIISLVQASVVPILPVKNNFATNFSEFDPMKFSGNAFLFEQTDIYHIFEKLIRFLENIRYAGDRRTLMENLKKTF